MKVVELAPTVVELSEMVALALGLAVRNEVLLSTAKESFNPDASSVVLLTALASLTEVKVSFDSPVVLFDEASSVKEVALAL